MTYDIESFIHVSNELSTRGELFDLYLTAISNYGFERAVYTFITDHDTIGEKAGHGILGNYPDDWMSFYSANGYEKLDPVPQQVKYSSQVFAWDELRSSQLTQSEITVLDEANEAKLCDGVAIPLYNARCEIAGMGIARTDQHETPHRNMQSVLQILTRQFHECYCGLDANSDTRGNPKLTTRQIEVLKWWAIDKTACEIGLILGISENTVNYHKKEIYRRLETNSRMLSVVKAIRLGIIPLDRIVV